MKDSTSMTDQERQILDAWNLLVAYFKGGNDVGTLDQRQSCRRVLWNSSLQIPFSVLLPPTRVPNE